MTTVTLDMEILDLELLAVWNSLNTKSLDIFKLLTRPASAIQFNLEKPKTLVN